MRRAAASVAALLMVACSAKTPVVNESLPAGVPVVTSSPPALRAPVPVAKKAVFTATNGLWLYDVKTDAISQFAQGEGLALAKFITETDVSFLQDAGGGSVLRAVDLKTRKVRDLFSVPGGIQTYGWSPDHQTVAYITTDTAAFPHLYFRQIVGTGAPRAVTTLARAFGRESDISDQLHIEWSADGNSVLVVYTPADGEPGSHAVTDDASQLQVRGADGSLQFSADQSGEPTMGVWSGKSVYFRARTGVRHWVPGKTASVGARGGLAWFDPSASRDGRFIAFDTGASSMSVRVRRFDVKTKVTSDVTPQGFFSPVYVDANTIWAQRVQRCEPDCLTPIVAGPEVDAFDIKTGKGKKLALTTLVDADVFFGAAAG